MTVVTHVLDTTVLDEALTDEDGFISILDLVTHQNVLEKASPAEFIKESSEIKSMLRSSHSEIHIFTRKFTSLVLTTKSSKVLDETVSAIREAIFRVAFKNPIPGNVTLSDAKERAKFFKKMSNGFFGGTSEDGENFTVFINRWGMDVCKPSTDGKYQMTSYNEKGIETSTTLV